MTPCGMHFPLKLTELDSYLTSLLCNPILQGVNYKVLTEGHLGTLPNSLNTAIGSLFDTLGPRRSRYVRVIKPVTNKLALSH